MEWEGRRESGNVEDRRSMAKVGLAVGGGVSILALILALVLGVDPRQLMGPNADPQRNGRQGDPQGKQAPLSPEEEKAKKFVSVVLADTEDVWHDLFKKVERREYREPKLVLFSGRVESACGLADSAVGPFYCPADEKLYIDLTFFDELSSKFKAPGDFAQAYVVAHEVGHHVQKLLGISDQVHAQQARLSKAEYNRVSVRLELQADYLAGVWAHHAQRTKKILEPGDLKEALRAANAIGDDRLQKQSRGVVVPDSFTHGTSEQRIRWFQRGFETGDFSERKRNELFTLPYDEL